MLLDFGVESSARLFRLSLVLGVVSFAFVDAILVGACYRPTAGYLV